MFMANPLSLAIRCVFQLLVLAMLWSSDHTKVCRMLSSCISYKIKFLEFQITICFHSVVKLLKFTCTPYRLKKDMEQPFVLRRLRAFLLIIVPTTGHQKVRADATGHWIIQGSQRRYVAPGCKKHLSLLVNSSTFVRILVASRHSTTSNYFNGLDELLDWTAPHPLKNVVFLIVSYMYLFFWLCSLVDSLAESLLLRKLSCHLSHNLLTGSGKIIYPSKFNFVSK